jgi:hypothetical protein
MAESAPEKQSWAIRVTDMVSKLVRAANITWDHQDNWRGRHVIAREDLSLSSTKKAYSLKVGDVVHVDKRSYSRSEYTLWDDKTIPAANVSMVILEGEPWADKRPDAPLSSKETFYLGNVTKAYEYQPPPPVTIKKGSTAFLDSDQAVPSAEYEVQDTSGGLFQATVPAASVEVYEIGPSVPNHEAGPIRLLCFELFPYAALRAGLMSDSTFFSGVAKRTSQADGSTSWARFLGGNLAGQPEVKVKDLKKAHFGRGDVIVLYNGPGSGIHTVTASGETDPEAGPMVYSLAETPDNHPGRWPLTVVADTFSENDAVAYVKAFTPRSPE